jgi:hypothetical protein
VAAVLAITWLLASAVAGVFIHGFLGLAVALFIEFRAELDCISARIKA